MGPTILLLFKVLYSILIHKLGIVEENYQSTDGIQKVTTPSKEKIDDGIKRPSKLAKIAPNSDKHTLTGHSVKR